jgi:hypothetical protein
MMASHMQWCKALHIKLWIDLTPDLDVKAVLQRRRGITLQIAFGFPSRDLVRQWPWWRSPRAVNTSFTVECMFLSLPPLSILLVYWWRESFLSPSDLEVCSSKTDFGPPRTEALGLVVCHWTPQALSPNTANSPTLDALLYQLRRGWRSVVWSLWKCSS